jgi:hypothetical protein
VRTRLDLLEHHVFLGRGHRDPQLVGEQPQHLGRAADHQLDSGALRAGREVGAEGNGVHRVTRLLQERVHVDPVGAVGWHPAGGGVRMEEISLLFQITHRISNRRGRDAQVEPPDHGTTTGRLGGVHVRADHRLQDELLALREWVSDHASGRVKVL